MTNINVINTNRLIFSFTLIFFAAVFITTSIISGPDDLILAPMVLSGYFLGVFNFIYAQVIYFKKEYDRIIDIIFLTLFQIILLLAITFVGFVYWLENFCGEL
jgi:hypothetical protein